MTSLHSQFVVFLKMYHIAEICPDMIRMEWDPVVNAQSYLIYKLGEKFMEVFANTNNPFIEIPMQILPLKIGMLYLRRVKTICLEGDQLPSAME